MKGFLFCVLLIQSNPLVQAEENSSLATKGAESPKPSPAKQTKKAKVRTLKQVIDLALREGRDQTLQADFSKLLLGVESEFPIKNLRYKPSLCPDKREHTFNVLVSKDEDGSITPTGLYLTVIKGETREGVRFVKGEDFFASLDGTLKKSLTFDGKRDELDPALQDVAAEGVLGNFQKELEFHLKTVPALGIEFAR